MTIEVAKNEDENFQLFIQNTYSLQNFVTDLVSIFKYLFFQISFCCILLNNRTSFKIKFRKAPVALMFFL